jgi:hypothetical protein
MLNQLLLELREQDGPNIVTFGLLVALIALIGVVGMMLLGDNSFTLDAVLDAGSAVAVQNAVGP